MVCQSVDRVDDFWSIAGLAETVQIDLSVLNYIVQDGGHLVHRIGELKHYAQSVKDIGLGLRGRVSGTPVQPRRKRDRILNGRLNLIHAPKCYERTRAVLGKLPPKRGYGLSTRLEVPIGDTR